MEKNELNSARELLTHRLENKGADSISSEELTNILLFRIEAELKKLNALLRNQPEQPQEQTPEQPEKKSWLKKLLS